MINFASDLSLGHELTWALQQTITTDTDTDSAAIDLNDYVGPVHIFISLGNYGDASTQTVVKLRTSATSGGTYADVAGATKTFAASATANDNSAHMIVARDWPSRYGKVRVTTSGGGTPSVPITVTVLGRKGRGGPTGVKTNG